MLKIKKFYAKLPRKHLSKVEIYVNDTLILKEEGISCEFTHEVETLTENTVKVASVIGNALECEVIEE